MADHDRRLTLAREDLATTALQGTVDAARFADPKPTRVIRDRIGLYPRPDPKAPLDSVLLFGETFDVLEVKDGWAWGQSTLDGYVGFIRVNGLRPADGPDPTHIVASLGAQVYAKPELKISPRTMLPFGARVPVADQRDGYVQIGPQAWMADHCLLRLDTPAEDWVAAAEQFTGVPYVWGGRSSYGIDCSALVQLSRQIAGHDCPRDSDMQEGAMGETLAPDATLQRGDLVFWKGHVGVMASASEMVHANAHHMAVTREPVQDAIARIQANGDGAPTRRARLD